MKQIEGHRVGWPRNGTGRGARHTFSMYCWMTASRAYGLCLSGSAVTHMPWPWQPLSGLTI